MNIDFKITTWERVCIPDGREKEILEKIKKGKITITNDIFNELSDEGGIECNHLLEVDEPMSVEDNGGEATIEVMENHEVIWDNKPK